MAILLRIISVFDYYSLENSSAEIKDVKLIPGMGLPATGVS